MKIQQLRLDPSRFDAIPDDERALLVLLGHACNEITVLTKCLVLAANDTARSGPKWHASLAHALIFMRLIAGKLNETWELLQRGYFKKKLSQEYDSRLDKDAAESLRRLKDYFGRKNAITEIRHEFAFHYSLPHAKKRGMDEFEAVAYLHDATGNTLYYFSEVLVSSALLEQVLPGRPDDALHKMTSEVLQIGRDTQTVANTIMGQVLAKHLGEFEAFSLEELDIGDVPEASDLRLPFFMNYLEERETEERS